MALSGLWSRVTGAIVGLAVGRAAGNALRPTFELVRQESWEANPYAILEPGILAELVATGVTPEADAAAMARREGLRRPLFDALVQHRLNAAPIDAALQMLRRGSITEGQFRHALAKAGYEQQYHDAFVGLRGALVAPSDLVRFGVREVFDPEQRDALNLDAEFPPAFADRLANQGYSESQARDYWAAHWELPSYTQATEMLFRKEISPARFNRLLRALDYAPTWRGPLEAIARRIPTVPDFTRMAYREVFDPEQRSELGLDAEFPTAFADKVALHGMSADDAKDLWAAHWRLPSARQGYQMVWRGEMGLPELRKLLKALDYPPKWRDRLFNIAFVKPGRIDLKRMLRHGIKTEAEVLEGYKAIGYAPDDAADMTRIAVAELGATDTAQPWATTARRRLYTVTHNEYLAESIDEATARANLARVGATAAEATAVLGLWDSERSIQRLELTPAQIRKAWKKNLLTEAEALAELEERGMTAEDADIFLQSG